MLGNMGPVDCCTCFASCTRTSCRPQHCSHEVSFSKSDLHLPAQLSRLHKASGLNHIGELQTDSRRDTQLRFNRPQNLQESSATERPGNVICKMPLVDAEHLRIWLLAYESPREVGASSPAQTKRRKPEESYVRGAPRGTGHGDMAGGSTLRLTFKEEVPETFMNPGHQKPSAESYLRYNANVC